MIRFTEEQKMILNCYEGGKIKVIREVQRSIEELKSTDEDPEMLELLTDLAPFIFHVFFIGFCFLSGRHRFFQTIFPTDTITELAYFMIITLV